MAVQLPPFVETPVDEISAKVDNLRKTFFSHKTRDLNFRIVQLRKLYYAISDFEAEILEACKKDLGKGFFEAMISEIKWCQNDIVFMTKNLEKWSKDEKPDDIGWSNKLVSPRIRKDPLGVVLVIGAFNFPVNLSFGPMIGAISGGNTVVLKPSEGSPNCAAVMQKIMEAALDPDCYTCIQGGVPQMKALLAERWDKIFFTGSANTGKIIAKAAAENLTPVTLELGGRNPAIVTKKANIHLAARRLLWAKAMNAGQVCISHNYTLVDRDVLPAFKEEIKTAMKEFFPKGIKDSPDFGRINNKRSFDRIKKMLDNTSGKIIAGGTMDPDQLFIELTVVEVSEPEDSLIVEESFGPLVPLLGVDNLDEAISIANKVDSTPLAAYAFGSKEETAKVLAQTRSGGASLNDGLFHGVIPTLAFGGVGNSGTGSYRGKASFDCFVHRRPVTMTPNWMEMLLGMRYPPYTMDKYKQLSGSSNQTPNFDRNGKEKFSLLDTVGYVLTLGSGSVSGGALRAAVVAGLAVAVKQVMDRRAKSHA